MTAQKRTPARTTKRTNTTPTSEKPAPEQGKQPASKRTESAPKPVKVVRKGPRLTAGAKLRRALAWPKMEPAAETLLTQACRVADRLEVLDRMHTGDPGVWLAVKIADQVAEVRLVGTVREEAQQSEVLRKLIMDIQRMRPAGSGDGPNSKPDTIARIITEIYGKAK